MAASQNGSAPTRASEKEWRTKAKLQAAEAKKKSNARHTVQTQPQNSTTKTITCFEILQATNWPQHR